MPASPAGQLLSPGVQGCSSVSAHHEQRTDSSPPDSNGSGVRDDDGGPSMDADVIDFFSLS